MTLSRGFISKTAITGVMLLLLPGRITSENYSDAPIFTGDLDDVDVGSAPCCPIIHASPERASDCIEIAPTAIAIAVPVCQTNDRTADQFVKPSRLTGSHFALEKQLHKSGCDYRYCTKPRDYSGFNGSAATWGNAFA